MSHIYSDTFFDYINQSARASAKPFVSLLFPLLKPSSVIDLGSGRGVWMDEWRKGGAGDVLAVDGDYVDRAQLAVAPEQFMAADLTQPVVAGSGRQSDPRIGSGVVFCCGHGPRRRVSRKRTTPVLLARAVRREGLCRL